MHEKTRQCRTPQVLPTLQWTHDRSFRLRDRGTPTFVLGLGGRQNSVVTADLLGSSSRVKPLVAEEKGVRTVRRLIKNSICLLMEHISTTSLCRAVLQDAHRHSGGEIVDRPRDTPHSQLRQPDWTAKMTNEFPQVHIHPHSVMPILCAARAHCSFPHLQIKSLLTSHPVLHDAPDFLHCCHPTTLQLAS